MLVKYIDNNYIIERLQKSSWKEVEEPDFYITMASNRVKALIFPSEQGNPNDINSYNEEQQEAIKLATAIYAMWYFDTNYDFTNGSVSVNFGGVSMSESKTYNGEMVLPNVFDILKQANLIPTTETFIFHNGTNDFEVQGQVSRKEFKKVQQDLEYETDRNIRQDKEIRDLQDEINKKLAYTGISPIVVDEILKTISVDFDEFNTQNTNVLTKEQVYNAIYTSGIAYQENFTYQKDWIVQIVDGENNLEWFLSLKNSTGINPLTNENKEEYWKRLEAQEIDLNIILEQVKPYVLEEINKAVPKEVQKQLDALPETDYIQETANQILGFENEADKELYEQKTGAQLTEHEPQFIQDIKKNKTEIEKNKTALENEITVLKENKAIIVNESTLNTENINNKIKFFSGYWSTPQVLNTNRTICNNFNKDKLISLTIAVSRGSDFSPIMFWPNADFGSSHNNTAFPFTIEINNSNDLMIWRQSSTNDGAPWPRIYMYCLYISDNDNEFRWNKG